MGTNYYANVHLGKSTFDVEPAGSFLWAVHLADLSWGTGDAEVTDEYGESESLSVFLDRIARKRQVFDYVRTEFC